MTRVLVVDDSSVDRALVGRLLVESGSYKVEYAIDGQDGIDKIDQSPPDVVVTDLVMPEKDGFALVSHVREKHPLVPVILMTSKGNEDIAVQALQRGASSYVPKKLLARNLLDTLAGVLSVSLRRRGHRRLMDRLADYRATFQLPNDRSLIPLLVSTLQEHVAYMGVCDEADTIRVGVALEEALVNALYHGNLEVGSELRESDYAAYYKLVEERSVQRPYCERRVKVDVRIGNGEAQFTISDEGPGFNPDDLPDPTDPENLEKVSGRGLLLIRTFMDEVRHNSVGNEVTLVKRCSREAPNG